MSASVVFDALRLKAFVVTLTGAVIAFAVAQAPTISAAASAPVGPFEEYRAAPSSFGVECQWQHAAGTPIFSAPAVAARDGSLIYAAVDGSVAALSTAGSKATFICLVACQCDMLGGEACRAMIFSWHCHPPQGSLTGCTLWAQAAWLTAPI